jgi:hypothetical protein
MSPCPIITPFSALGLQTSEYLKALKFSKRRETYKPGGGIRQRAGSLSYLITTTAVGVSTSMSSTCPEGTATWNWDGHRKRHHIQVHPELPRAMLDDAKNTPARRVELTKACIAHEVCHGLHTSRSPDIGRLCADAKVPFRLLNLMEDCRIEYLYVLARGKEHKFRWRLFDDKMLPAGAETKSPIEWLFTMKSREPILFKSWASVMAPFKWAGRRTITLPEVSYDHPMKTLRLTTSPVPVLINQFYKLIVNAKTTEELIPIARYWQDVFKREELSSLPPIIIDTVPTSIGGMGDPSDPDGGGDSSDAERAVREVDHRAVTERSSAEDSGGRAILMTDKVLHFNTDQFVRQPPRSGFLPLLAYCNHN